MGSLPASFERAGFVSPSKTRGKIMLPGGYLLKPLLIGQEGETDSGKTEFALSTPGTIHMLSVDRNFQGVFDNPNAPKARNLRVGVKVFHVPMQGTANTTEYGKYYASIRDSFYDCLASPDSTVVFMDGDSDFWEIHILAHFGKTTQIYPQTRYAAPYAEKRAQICRAWDSGKIVFFSNKVKDEYEDVLKPDGTKAKDEMGNDLRTKTGRKERQGFKDQGYLFDLQLRHKFKPARVEKVGGKMVSFPMEWGIEILKCKHDMSLVGLELWGSDCNFRGLVDNIFPGVPPQRWGFKA